MNSNIKSYIKIITVIIFIICVIAFTFKYGIDMKHKNDMIEVYNSRNTFLDVYNENKELSESYLKVYDIVDENSYQSVKNELYNNLSYEMQQELFPTVNYSGLALHDLETSIIRVLGTNKLREEVNTFLIEYNLVGVNYNQNITNLINIKDGKIIGVTRIK